MNAPSSKDLAKKLLAKLTEETKRALSHPNCKQKDKDLKRIKEIQKLLR